MFSSISTAASQPIELSSMVNVSAGGLYFSADNVHAFALDVGHVFSTSLRFVHPNEIFTADYSPTFAHTVCDSTVTVESYFFDCFSRARYDQFLFFCHSDYRELYQRVIVCCAIPSSRVLFRGSPSLPRLCHRAWVSPRFC